MLKAIPEYWKPALERCENIKFPYTDISLSSVYDINLKLLSDVLKANGGKIKGDKYYTTIQKPKKALQEAVNSGLIDAIATDHAPHLLSEKEGGALKAMSGMPMIQFKGGSRRSNHILYTGLMHGDYIRVTFNQKTTVLFYNSLFGKIYTV